MKHECVDHLRSFDHNGKQYYRCRECGKHYTSAEVDQMHEDLMTADLYDEDPEFWQGLGLKRPAKQATKCLG